MKKIPVFFFATVITLLQIQNLAAQNVGIGTNTPLNKLHIVGSFVATEETRIVSTPPTAAQTFDMNTSGGAFLLPETYATGRIFDPGGSAGNYTPNNSSAIVFGGGANVRGIKVVIEEIDLGTGDSLIFKNANNLEVNYLALGHDNDITGTYIFNAQLLEVVFLSNSDINTGQGFSLLLNQLYGLVQPNFNPGYVGNTIFFDTKDAVFRAGKLSDGSIGAYSTATGYLNTASGFYSTSTGRSNTASGESSTAMGLATTASGRASTALGRNSLASGESSTAIGYNTTASNDYSFAIGNENTASGGSSVAMGAFTTASGLNSFSIGNFTTASGNNSTAMGSYVRTNNKTGSFIIGDNTVARGTYYNDVDNQMQMVFAGGYRLYTGTAASGVYMNGGDNSWSAVSDSRKKEKVLPVNGETFLNRIAQFTLGTWNYKGQDSKKFRHYGPMAQEFYAAFGKDAMGNIGCDTLINQQDFLGVNFIAIQALEKRTAKIEALQKQNTVLQQQINQLNQSNLLLQQQIENLSGTLAAINKKLELLAAKENIQPALVVKK